ncbi:Mucin-2 [Tupaia chinensis]|uniref:Mucin-2 n=1 Tax=Tupaia chinensis TaxID=246437 RepID=L8Y845_TUPCH|nr:Mucin-2 [Tupaia chinensis]
MCRPLRCSGFCHAQQHLLLKGSPRGGNAVPCECPMFVRSPRPAQDCLPVPARGAKRTGMPRGLMNGPAGAYKARTLALGCSPTPPFRATMGLPLVRLVAICLALSVVRGSELQREGRTRNHGHNVCSTWGDFHYKTFDGDVFRFPGLCDYNFASDCRDSYKEFAVHLKRGPGLSGGHPQIESVLLTIKDDTIYLTRQLAVVNGAL